MTAQDGGAGKAAADARRAALERIAAIVQNAKPIERPIIPARAPLDYLALVAAANGK